MTQPKTKDWFISRIGKRVYRDKDNCNCVHCAEVVKSGLVIMDERHADYLACVDAEFASEGIYLNYRDTPKTSAPYPFIGGIGHVIPEKKP